MSAGPPPPWSQTIADLKALAAGGGGQLEVATQSEYERTAYALGGELTHFFRGSEHMCPSAPIGRWRAPADPAAAVDLARILLEADLALAESEKLLSGEAYATLSFTTQAGPRGVSVRAGSPVIADVDRTLHRLASQLKGSGEGYAVICELELEQEATRTFARISFANLGQHPCLLPNPLTARAEDANPLYPGDPFGSNFLRVEIAEVPPQLPGTTMTTPPQFSAVPFPSAAEHGATAWWKRLSPFSAHAWAGAFLRLPGNGRLTCPVRVPIEPPNAKVHCVRALFANTTHAKAPAAARVVVGHGLSEWQTLGGG